MKFCLPLLLVLALVACVKEPVALYPDQGVVVMTSDSVTVGFIVPDTDSVAGWNPVGNGEALKTMTVILKENGNKDINVEDVSWSFYDCDGNYLASRNETYIPPIKIESGKDTTITVDVTVWEHLAYDLDNADGTEDNLGSGTIVFEASGYDLERGNDINCVPSYTPMSVSK